MPPASGRCARLSGSGPGRSRDRRRPLPPQELLGTNKLGGICGTGSAAYRYAHFVRIPWRSLLPAAGLAFLAALAGASLVSRVPAAVFRPLLPTMLVGVLAYVLCRIAGIRTARRHGTGFVRIVFIAVVSALIAKTAWDGFR
jgi:uncharacterized membrane protein YfcA